MVENVRYHSHGSIFNSVVTFARKNIILACCMFACNAELQLNGDPR